jgi:hypothetical protein
MTGMCLLQNDPPGLAFPSSATGAIAFDSIPLLAPIRCWCITFCPMLICRDFISGQIGPHTYTALGSHPISKSVICTSMIKASIRQRVRNRAKNGCSVPKTALVR